MRGLLFLSVLIPFEEEERSWQVRSWRKKDQAGV
jgi:hypothetical protein